jgi:DNA-binding LacI/PurR family transcriptional regulator
MASYHKSPTMKDVARIADVSLQTVSTVVNDKPGVTDETRQRVLAAVAKLGYRPYSIARSLRTRRTRTIALVISDIANPSFATMASAAEVHAHASGYSLVLYNTHDDVEREASYIAMASERWVDGVLFVATEDRLDGLTALHSAGIPSVAIDRIPQGYDGPSVTIDNLAAGRLAAQHLLELGHTRLAHISGPLNLRLARERQEGFRRAIEESGVTPGLVVCIEGGWTCAEGYDALQAVLRQGPPPSAIFAANDRMAMGAMAALADAGLRVPDDTSIVGLDDIEVSAYQCPPLTTVQQSFGELATTALHLLLDLLADRPPPTTQIVMQPRLVVRQSTRRAAAATL